MDKKIIRDMLESIKRLNTELDSRVDFEHCLIDKIQELENEVDKYKSMYNEQYLKADLLERDYASFKEEAQLFKNCIEDLFLRDRESFVWDSNKERVLIHSNETGTFREVNKDHIFSGDDDDIGNGEEM